MSDRTGVVVPCILSLALAAWAPASALGSDASPLGGPSISEQAKAGSLISKGFKGEVLPLDAPPPIAALDLLDLDEMTESGSSLSLMSTISKMAEVSQATRPRASARITRVECIPLRWRGHGLSMIIELPSQIQQPGREDAYSGGCI